MSRFARMGCSVLVGGMLLVCSQALNAQQKGPPPKRGQAIEIRGQVPTPQVVTVRPREVPAYDRQLLAPAFYTGTGSVTSTAVVQLVPESQIRETTVLDTLVKATAIIAPTLSFPSAPRADSTRRTVPVSAAAGASTAEMEAMRHEMAQRRARLDSLQREMNAGLQAPVDLQSPPPRRRSAADSAARAEEIESIRRELEYRKQRLDSLQREVNKMGKEKAPSPSNRQKTTTDSTTAAPSTPRGRR